MKNFPNALLLFVVFCVCSLGTSAQIVNMEVQRDASDTTGWSGGTDLGFSFFKYVISGYTVYNETRVQYQTKKHLFLLKGAIDYTNFNNIAYSNSGYVHLRHNLKLSKRWRIEEFVQAQYNPIMGLTTRLLAGAGPRMKLIGKPKLEAYIAALPMYEYLETNFLPYVHEKENTVRVSTYLNFTFAINELLSLIHTTYYQPMVTDFQDYKINSDNSLRINIGKKTSIDIGFHYTYNSRIIPYFPMSTYYMTDAFRYYF